MWLPRRRAWPSSLSSKRASWSPPEEAAASWSPDWPTDVRPDINTNALVDRVYRQVGSLFNVSDRSGVFLLPCSQQASAHGPERRAQQYEVIWCLNVSQPVWTIRTFQRWIFKIVPRAWQDHMEETEPHVSSASWGLLVVVFCVLFFFLKSADLLTGCKIAAPNKNECRFLFIFFSFLCGLNCEFKKKMQYPICECVQLS